MPATGGLESLPRVGLIDNSLTITLAAYGYIGERGDQWIGAEPLERRRRRTAGAPGRHGFPQGLAHHLRPAKPLHGAGRKPARSCAFSPAPAIWRIEMTALNRALGAFYGLALGDALGMPTQSLNRANDQGALWRDHRPARRRSLINRSPPTCPRARSPTTPNRRFWSANCWSKARAGSNRRCSPNA